MSPRFQTLYSRTGRPSIPPERLIRALLLQVLYTIRSERQLVEHLDYNILFRWFVGLGLDDAVWVSPATGTAERDTALGLLGDIPRQKRITLGADKGYDVAAFVEALREAEVTPHIARKKRHSALDARTTRHDTYEVSQRKRKRVEEIFGWLKTVGTMRKLRHHGLPRVDWMFTFALAAYNFVRIRNLTAVTA
jgi:IS5 family transposase